MAKNKFKYSRKIISNSIVYRISMTVDLVFFLFEIILMMLYFLEMLYMLFIWLLFDCDCYLIKCELNNVW